MDEVLLIQIMEPILIWVVGVGMTIGVVGRRILNSVFITSILGEGIRTCATIKAKAYLIFLFIVHEGGNGMTLIGVLASLSTYMDSGPSNPELVDRAGDDVRRSGTVIRRHE